MTTMLRASNLSLSFGAAAVLRDVSCELNEGEILGLIGSNGAGKSTLLNCLTGFYAPDEGIVEIGGTTYRRVEPRMLPTLRVARTFQHPSVVEELTVRENVAMGVAAQRSADEGRIRRIRDLLTPLDESAADGLMPLVGLAHVAGRRVGELSYAQRKLVELARAVATRPRILLLDEPASGMNGEERVELARILRKLHDELALCMLVVDHSMRFISATCTRVVAMHLGEVIAEGATDAVLSAEVVVDSYLGVSNRSLSASVSGTTTNGGPTRE